MSWITALKSVSIRALVEQGQLHLGLFGKRNLVELESPDYPGERHDGRDDLQLAAAVRAVRQVDLEDPLKQLAPARPG